MFNRAVSRLSRKRPPSDAGKGKGDLHDLSVQQGLVTSQCRGAVPAQREDSGRTAPTDVPKTPGPESHLQLPAGLAPKATMPNRVQSRHAAHRCGAAKPRNLLSHSCLGQKKEKIFNLMKYDSYSRFLKSDLFLKHKRTEEEGEESPDAQTAAKRASRIYNT
ncbi:regulator of G-protein signaling 10 isoform X4 [Rhinolophus sinicus]|uniref:regulator of G-protein signaling 10 isoform X4 n=1 Tax=Rhinolophus sinicus TaxID=89399 RepID=UPI003D7B5CED